MQIQQKLDARGLNCPLPILRAKKALDQLSKGEILEVLTTDKGSLNDFDSLCQQTGNQLLKTENTETYFLFLIQKMA